MTRYRLTTRLPVGVLPLVLITAIGPVLMAQQSGSTDQAKALSEIARSLADQQRVVILPAVGKKASGKIAKEDAKHDLARGASPVLLFRLPDAAAPYTLKIVSQCNCIGFSKSIFVPSGVFLNSEFVETSTFEEDDLKDSGSGVEAIVAIEGTRLADRYLLIHTRGDLIGQAAGSVQINMFFGMKKSRSMHGKVELKAEPIKVKR